MTSGPMQLKRAEKKNIKLKLAVSATSGGGKTYSSLLLAKGLSSGWEKIAVIDTENDSACLYDHLGAYNVLTITPPFSPEKYIEALTVCANAKMETVIIDSISHEWEAEGGALDLQAQLGGRYQDWSKVTPRHQAFINAILQAPYHVISTMRRKTDYEMTKEGNKTTVQKVGLKQIQRDGTEYEFTIHFALDQNHLAKAEKDRTGLFDKKPEFIITEQTGKQLLEWASKGAISAEPPPPELFEGTEKQLKRLSLALEKEKVPPTSWDAVANRLKGKPISKQNLTTAIHEATAQ